MNTEVLETCREYIVVYALQMNEIRAKYRYRGGTDEVQQIAPAVG